MCFILFKLIPFLFSAPSFKSGLIFISDGSYFVQKSLGDLWKDTELIHYLKWLRYNLAHTRYLVTKRHHCCRDHEHGRQPRQKQSCFLLDVYVKQALKTFNPEICRDLELPIQADGYYWSNMRTLPVLELTGWIFFIVKYSRFSKVWSTQKTLLPNAFSYP